MYKLAQRFFDFDDDAGGEGGGPNTPVPATPPAVPAAASDVASHVDDAAQAANQVAQKTGDDGWKVVADKLDGIGGKIDALLEKTAASVPTPEPPAAPTTPKPPAAPTVTPPKPAAERFIRRNGRKIKRPA